MANVKKFWFESDGSIPNHPAFPVLIYPEAYTNLNEIEDAFNRHGWTGSWIGGVFNFHHYHSNIHEVLGVVSGEADVMLGGEQGQTFQVKAGDVVLLPAGTGHKKLKASNDFQVCGAYPEGQSPNFKKEILLTMMLLWRKFARLNGRKVIRCMAGTAQCWRNGRPMVPRMASRETPTVNMLCDFSFPAITGIRKPNGSPIN